MENKSTLSAALEASAKNEIEQWVHKLLLSGPNKNIPLSDGLKQAKRYFIGPEEVNLRLFQRISGPEEEMQYKIDEHHFNYNVKLMVDKMNQGWDMPPLIVEFKHRHFYLCDGNHRYEALRRMGMSKYHVIFWCSSKEEFLELREIIIE